MLNSVERSLFGKTTMAIGYHFGDTRFGEQLEKLRFFGSSVGRVFRDLAALGSYLVDPASNICLYQRLSHACLSISNYTVKLRMAH